MTPAQLPDDAMVCYCASVTMGDLRAYVASGAPIEYERVTKAEQWGRKRSGGLGTLCTGCQGDLRIILRALRAA